MSNRVSKSIAGVVVLLTFLCAPSFRVMASRVVVNDANVDKVVSVHFSALPFEK